MNGTYINSKMTKCQKSGAYVANTEKKINEELENSGESLCTKKQWRSVQFPLKDIQLQRSQAY